MTSPSRNFREKFAILERSESVISLITLDGVNGLSILRYVKRKILYCIELKITFKMKKKENVRKQIKLMKKIK